ncbi:hypothetical protein [Actinokineospora pegani]|uniref:hypothetical protein n=1 Tax=Actinokineospora pegani TaxID=2654637 RepID=UPI0012EADEFA|nr:hypothetical protein [Actinokineospora pegani]
MATIRVDPAWVGQYASNVHDAAEVLAEGGQVMRTAPLTADSFGSLGKTVRVSESYLRAAEVLRAQLTRGVEALQSAATGLDGVAKQYQSSDDDGVASINRSGQA